MKSETNGIQKKEIHINDRYQDTSAFQTPIHEMKKKKTFQPKLKTKQNTTNKKKKNTHSYSVFCSLNQHISMLRIIHS